MEHIFSRVCFDSVSTRDGVFSERAKVSSPRPIALLLWPGHNFHSVECLSSPLKFLHHLPLLHSVRWCVRRPPHCRLAPCSPDSRLSEQMTKNQVVRSLKLELMVSSPIEMASQEKFGILSEWTVLSAHDRENISVFLQQLSQTLHLLSSSIVELLGLTIRLGVFLTSICCHSSNMWPLKIFSDWITAPAKQCRTWSRGHYRQNGEEVGEEWGSTTQMGTWEVKRNKGKESGK